jgi:hypothetical protein
MRRGLAIAVALLVGFSMLPAAFAVTDEDILPRHSKKRAETIEKLYSYLIYPIPIQVLSGQVSVSDIFDSSVKGRVTPVGQFHDIHAVDEYFFGLAVTPTTRVTDVQFKSLTVSGDKVAVEVDISFEPTVPAGRAFTLRQTGFFSFNEQDLVVSFDLTILNLGAAVNPKSVAEQEANIAGVCALLTGAILGRPATCPGTYADFNACFVFMHTIPYGTWDRANSNTVVCRQLHSLLTPFRPDVHCPHCSPSGGGACVDFPYESFFDTEF